MQKLAFQHAKPFQASDHFSSREMEIIQQICEGLTSQEIAEKLCISNKTVETHRFNIFQKANVKKYRRPHHMGDP
jgi:DNA-binding NarL/FixJ family response regulator